MSKRGVKTRATNPDRTPKSNVVAVLRFESVECADPLGTHANNPFEGIHVHMLVIGQTVNEVVNNPKYVPNPVPPGQKFMVADVE
jgi:hypothetical protein